MNERDAPERGERYAEETEDELARGVGRGEPEGRADASAVGPSTELPAGEMAPGAPTAEESRETEEAREQLAEAPTTARSETDRPSATRSGALPPPGYETAGMIREPRSSDEARREVEQTRERISHTLDEIEDRVGEKKRTLQENTIGLLDRAEERIAERPLFAVGVAFGAGLSLAIMMGGDDDEGSSGGSFVGMTVRRLALMGASRYVARRLQRSLS